MEILETIGFDLGHGETALAKAVVESIEPPQMLEINNRKNQITALGWHPKLGYLVGEQALIQAGVTQLTISFKQKPNNDPKYRETISTFVATYYRLLKESKQIESGESSYFYIGCPSGWSVSDRTEYQKLLQEAGISQINVVPESRAAFMQAKEAGKLEYDKLVASVLIVDIGSSTTDFTLVKNLEEIPIDFGSNTLGASLIDKAIFAQTLANHEQKTLLEKVFKEYPHHQARCELACRKAKEDYFSNEQLYSDPESFARGFESINEQIYFIPQVNKLLMEEILNQPLAELGFQSWIKTFSDSLNEAQEKLKQLGIVPKLVLMTGGASRMKFTHILCQEMFPEPETLLRPDPEPERCIALGLARVGRWDLRAAAFKQEVNKLFTSNQLKSLIERHIPELIKSLTKPLTDGLIVNAVKPGLKDWQKNKIRTLADLETSLITRAEQWLKSELAVQIINNQCAFWFSNKIQPDLAAQTDPICRKFQIPRSSLRFQDSIDPNFVNPELRIGDAILAETVAFIVNVVIGGGTVASIITLILTGHLTWPIALVYGASVMAAGMELNRKGVQDVIKTNVDVPSWVRSSFLSDKKIEDMCEQIKPELEKVIQEQLTADREAFDKLIVKVEQGLQKSLSNKVQSCIILIQ
ncbi:MAG: plasmid segregation protein ParM [Nostoc sp. DedVER02]|uniref:plasmid segregation protein ParM n=1 Tax=unclassified Nostoc TaxID=2593658 RepID=UPI002AD57342|nr:MULTISPECIES: plasmid segregation protein ParM [unclassified Nostoc]MDZ7990381.1 plasmid segregation protein ParM [Nostoc sp. DedVER02]MDZ8115927.1 plasmid segregation protein ParM [Nostoc sp. DedVER01b]